MAFRTPQSLRRDHSTRRGSPNRIRVSQQLRIKTDPSSENPHVARLSSYGRLKVYSKWAYGSPGEIRTPVDGSLPRLGVQSPSLAGSLFSTLASPLHNRATRDPGPGPSPNKPSAQRTIVGADETASSLLSLTRPGTSQALRIS